MENFAHTLLGLSLAKAGLERASPLAATTLLISSNLPDIDVLVRLRGGTLSYLQYHRGFTHGFVGLAVLAVALTAALVFIDRRFRLRQDPFRRPIRPFRIFLLAYLGGLGHSFMDFTNSYGVRPLLPFSDRWFYGDLAFVVDPWIWLMLGSAGVWLTAKTPPSIVFWLIAGGLTSFIVATALSDPSPVFPVTVPTAVRVVWFLGLGMIIGGALFRWGRMGESVARYSLLALAFYYGGMWIARQEARNRAAASLQAEGVSRPVAWPTPANPLLWQTVAASDEFIYSRYLSLADPQGEWRQVSALDPKLIEALRQAPEARTFLDFTRYAMAAVEEREGGYAVALRDSRFDLRMNVLLNQELTVQSVDVRWF
ncbi:MAG TPA: metal-dependent hydrolase [Blastocatellia bacterium]|nr:metal-dependent hydrolase [Blastocatellia bacterium]